MDCYDATLNWRPRDNGLWIPYRPSQYCGGLIVICMSLHQSVLDFKEVTDDGGR